MKLDLVDYVADLTPHANFGISTLMGATLHMHEIAIIRVYFSTPVVFLPFCTPQCKTSIGNRSGSIEDKCRKTAIYTNVYGDVVSYTSKTAKIKKGAITQQHIDMAMHCWVIAYQLFDFCCFRCVTHYVAVNICINCTFLHLYLLFHYQVWLRSRTIAHLIAQLS